ncbi:hypothetical protein [Nocardioides bizhenqiangii]|uniref:PepSY domain-containing protein n=1 Tax=Nocardioides bizhenqiangii TaxID=3095076 RepID=A0ABZ0ZQD3_9ACTN|nr:MULTISPECIES: hypothetical protein [unclassified Nocardioides]MDZ5619531.1 hypothetical protein [Nocardioides sp. HM23]WQQ26452.1 hypothetical protein SHK19_21165 [Nocardioides sp. HM61]
MSDRVRGKAYRRKANGELAEDRQWQRYRRPSADDVTRENRDTSGQPIEPPAPPNRRRPGGRWLVGVAVIGAGAVGFLLLSEAEGPDGERAPDPLPAEERYRPIIDQATLDEVAAELRRATGATAVLEVWIDGSDAIRLTVPPAADGDLAEEYGWDGAVLEKTSASQPGDRVSFPLDVVDPDVLVEIDEQARSRSDGTISDSRARIRKPVTEYDEWIYVKVDEVDHGGVAVWADIDGQPEGDLVHEDWRDD